MGPTVGRAAIERVDFLREVNMSIRPIKRLSQGQADPGRRGRAPAPRVRLRQHVRLRPVPAARRFPQRRSGGLSGGLPVAPAPRHRDDHLRAGGNRGARRQHGEPRRHRRRRRPVDDRGQRHHPPGDAQGRPGGPHARVPVVGQPSGVAQNDAAALPGGESGRHPGGHGRRRHPASASSAEASGARTARWMASPPTPCTSM